MSTSHDSGNGVEWREAQVAAQAKVNLRLRVLAREASGFHQLETLFLRIDLADTVRVRRTEGARSLRVWGDVDLGKIGPAEHNLAWRAADAYLTAAADAGGFAIEIEKRIPIGGGLGGGSADAGAVLRALDAMSPAPMGELRLLQIAASLGADVPFLASESAYALAWGRGERLLSLTPPPKTHLVLVVPPFAVNTASAFGWLAEQRAARARTPGEVFVLDAERLAEWSYLQSVAVNDFESVVCARHPEIADVIASLRNDAGLAPAMLSGSGSTVFGVVPISSMLPSIGGGGLGVILTATATRVEPVSLIV